MRPLGWRAQQAALGRGEVNSQRMKNDRLTNREKSVRALNPKGLSLDLVLRDVTDPKQLRDLTP